MISDLELQNMHPEQLAALSERIAFELERRMRAAHPNPDRNHSEYCRCDSCWDRPDYERDAEAAERRRRIREKYTP